MEFLQSLLQWVLFLAVLMTVLQLMARFPRATGVILRWFLLFPLYVVSGMIVGASVGEVLFGRRNWRG